MNEQVIQPQIIVMEDETVIRELICKSLRKKGHDVLEAPDGQVAIDLFQSLDVDTRVRTVLILDLIVPGGLGGRETLREIRQLAPAVKAIIASGLADDGELSDLEEPGKTSILTKPYNMQDLDAALRSVW